jgi:hypothetical protein
LGSCLGSHSQSNKVKANKIFEIPKQIQFNATLPEEFEGYCNLPEVILNIIGARTEGESRILSFSASYGAEVQALFLERRKQLIENTGLSHAFQGITFFDVSGSVIFNEFLIHQFLILDSQSSK